MFEVYFSNSIIIHQVKTEKITTMKLAWIPGLQILTIKFLHLCLFVTFCFSKVDLSNNGDSVSLAIQHLKFSQILLSPVVCHTFNSLPGVWIS